MAANLRLESRGAPNAGGDSPGTVPAMYILIEPAQFPDDLHFLAQLAVSVVAEVTRLPIGGDGQIDGPVDDSDDRRVVRVTEGLLDVVSDDGPVPEALLLFLRAVVARLENR